MMDPIRIEKFQAMKRYKRRSSRQLLLPGLLKYTLAITLLGLFLSSPLWLPYLSSFFELLFSDLIPGAAAAALGPKCLFVMGNLIVIFLVGECKFLRPPAATADIYQEYVNKQTSLRQQCEGKAKVKGGALEKDVAEEEEEEEEEEEKEEEISDFDGEEEEEEELTELNKRSENLIARVNEQWRHEARMLL